MNPSPLQNFIGGSLQGVVLRLAIISLLVGVVLAIFGLSPMRLLMNLQFFVEEFFGTGMAALKSILAYMITGAAIVLPIWFVIRLIKRV